jgi:hypothetical protein
LILGGLGFAICGHFIQRGSLPARRIAQAIALCGYVWIALYAIAGYRIFPLIAPTGDLPIVGRPNEWFRGIWITAGTMLMLVFPTALLFILSRPRHSSLKSPLN